MGNLVQTAGTVLIAMAMALSPQIHADTLPPPTGEVLLTITGELENPNVGSEVHLDLAALQSLPVTEFTTNTPWSDGVQQFEGVRVDVLLNAAGAQGTGFVAVGLDDYKFTVSGIDFDRYPVIVAYRHNGEPISVRNLGPLRIVMPFDDYPELLTPKNESSCVWQLVRMELL
jgi:hypothetical protein